MSGTITPYVDFKTSNDTGANNVDSIQPLSDGETVNQTVLRRPHENVRVRTEALRSLATDALYLQNADRSLILAGPGKIRWDGTLAAYPAATYAGQLVLSDVLWLMPMLTPGFPQVSPVPPVVSAYGTLHLQRASDSMNSILVTSQRRSYAAGDQINVTVTAGAVFSCTLRTEDSGTYRRTIEIVATGTTTLSTVISALNALTPPAPDNASALVTAALEGGALGTDVVLSPQARQFVVGNYDGEAHTLTNANLAAFFATATNKLAEGDTLCVQFSMLNDTASTGGRRQALPENSNTTVTSGMLFNSRVNPEKLVNALPICKVVDGDLVFATGAIVRAGQVDYSFSGIEQLRWEPSSPAGEGTVYVERPDQTYSGASLPPSVAPLGRLRQLGSKLLATAADSYKPRIEMPYSAVGGITLIYESGRDGQTVGTYTQPCLRVYVIGVTGTLTTTHNARWTGLAWAKDVAGRKATRQDIGRDPGLGAQSMLFRYADANWSDLEWVEFSQFNGLHPTTTANPWSKPLLSVSVDGTNFYSAVDHLGLRSGRVTEIQQNWLGTASAGLLSNGAGTWSLAGTGGSATQQFSSANINGPQLRLRVPASGNTALSESSWLFLADVTKTTLLNVLEWEADTSQLSGVNASCFMGYMHDSATRTADNVYFSKTSADADWHFITKGGAAPSTTDIDTGVTTGTYQSFRIELYGSGQPGGRRALAYIDGSLVAESTTNLPTGDNMPISFYLVSTGATNKDVFISPVTYRQRRSFEAVPL